MSKSLNSGIGSWYSCQVKTLQLKVIDSTIALNNVPICYFIVKDSAAEVVLFSIEHVLFRDHGIM